MPADFFEVSHPMGLLYLGTALERTKKYKVKIIDMRVGCKGPAEIREEIRAFRPDVTGLGALSYEAPCTHELARMVKEDFPQCPIVLGGPYPTSSADQALEDRNVDYCVIGEGDETLGELLEALEGGDRQPDTPGLAYRAGGRTRFTAKRPFIPDLDELGLPAWHLIHLEDYFLKPTSYQMHMRPEFMTLVTSRGCPYGCIYCHNMFGKRFRARSTEAVVEEIEILYHHHGIRELQIQDDVFNWIPERAKEICDRMVRAGIRMHVSFPNGLRGDIMDSELLWKLKRVGTFRISYAAESGSERIQKLIRKNMDLTKLKAVIAQTDRLGIFAHGFFMLGFPTETLDDMRRTVEYALTSKLHSATFFVVNTFEGSRLAKMMEKEGKGLDVEAKNYSYYSTSHQRSEVPTDTLAKLIRKANRRFFFDPARILKILRYTPSKAQLLTYLTFVLKRAFVQR